jgi:hypothetical protein
MGSLLETAIPAALGFVAAYQGGLTRTSRLHSMIRANLELVDKLPAEHPSRGTLTAHVKEQVDTLVRRQRRQFEPFTRAGVSFGVNVGFTVVTLLGILVATLELTGTWHPDPEPRSQGDKLFILGFYAALTVCFAGLAFKAWRQRQREHPEQLQPSP